MADFFDQYWEAIVAIFVLVTSVVSVIIASRTFQLQRVHNIKLVMPIIHIGQWDYENRLIVTLKNVGLGLAVVKKMTVYDKKGERKTCLYDWLPKALPGKMNYKEYWTPDSEFVVQPAEVIKLIEIPIDTSKTKEVQMREVLRRMIGVLTVEVCYEDIYETAMPIKRRELIHFLRLDNEN